MLLKANTKSATIKELSHERNNKSVADRILERAKN